MDPESPLLIPPGDGREGKIIISAVERRDGKKILIPPGDGREGKIIQTLRAFRRPHLDA